MAAPAFVLKAGADLHRPDGGGLPRGRPATHNALATCAPAPLAR